MNGHFTAASGQERRKGGVGALETEFLRKPWAKDRTPRLKRLAIQRQFVAF